MNAGKLFRRSGFGGVVIFAMLGLSACLPVPLGDPEKASIESSYIGAWEWRDGDKTNVLTIRPYDQRTYFVDAMTFAGTMDQPQPREHNLYKAWLTKVKGETFITMQPAETLALFPNEKAQKYYIVAKLKLEEGKLKGTGINGNFPAVKEAGTATALERVIADNIDNGAMWTTTIVASPVRPDRMEALGKLVKAFAQPTPQP
jgi:hypothetical protein